MRTKDSVSTQIMIKISSLASYEAAEREHDESVSMEDELCLQGFFDYTMDNIIASELRMPRRVGLHCLE